MNLEAGLLHESQRLGAQIEKVLKPASWAEALDMYAAFPDARPLAGATDLVLELHRQTDSSGEREAVLLDLWGLPKCTQIDVNGSEIEIGCSVTHNQVIDAIGLDHALDLLRMACLEIGSAQLRNRATVVGNVVTASPANDTVSALVALDSRVVIESSQGSREVPIRDFFTGFRKTNLERTELVRSIKVPRWSRNTIGTWFKVGNRSAQAISVVHAGIVLEIDNVTAEITRADIAIGSVSEVVSVSQALREYLIGEKLSAETAKAAAQIAEEAISPIDDVRGTATYRKAVTNTAIERSLVGLSEGFVANSEAAPRLGRDTSQSVSSQSEISTLSNIACEVNGTPVIAPLGANSILLGWLRANVSTGTKEGCSEGECGACTVRLNGAAVMSCLTPTAQADGASLVTVEGLATEEQLHPIQERFLEEFAVQCGFCTPGFLVAAAALLEENNDPSDQEIELALAGNLCRCTGYYSIIKSLREGGEKGRII